MYLGKTVDEMVTQQCGSSVCMQCGETPHVAWKFLEPGQGLVLCGACAQYLATQLLKDVRSYELGHAVTVKVRTEVASCRTPKTPRRGRNTKIKAV